MNRKIVQKPYFKLIFFAILSLLIYYFSGFGVGANFVSLLSQPINGVQRVFIYGRLKFFDSFLFWKNWQDYYQQNLKLKQKVQKLMVDSGKLAVCLEQKQAMEKMLETDLPADWHFIPAKVVGFYGKLKINIGQKAGVEKGMVLVSEDILVGRVDSVKSFSSLVSLVTDPGLKVPAVVRAPQAAGIRARGVVQGQVSGRVVLGEVLQSEKLAEGDLVFTSGKGEFPADLLIGEIVGISEQEGKVFQKAEIKSPLDFDRLRYVFVVKLLGENQ